MNQLKFLVLILFLFVSCPGLVGAEIGNGPAINIDLKQNVQTDNSSYTLIAPIGDTKSIPIDDIGSYFNIIFKIAIGICGALAVIMIVIGGVQYMGTESVFGKTEAKGQIVKAILGLLIALGAYALLNTISPALTGKGGLTLDKVNVAIEKNEIGVLIDNIGKPMNPSLPVSASNPIVPDPSKFKDDSPEMYEWAQKYGKRLKMTLKNGQMIEIIPCDRSPLATFNNFGTKFQMNKYLRASVGKIDSEWKKKGINYKISTGWSAMVCRFSRNTKTNKSKFLSYHSYGLALDLNVATNQLGAGKGTMPQELIALWKKEGWAWGGDWNDPMHFSKGEVGNSKLVGE